MKTYLSPDRCIGAAAFLAPTLAIYAPLSLAIISTAAGAVMAVMYLVGHRGFLTQLHPLSGLFAALFVFALVSVIWAIEPEEALDKLPRFALVLVPGFLFLMACRAIGPRSRKEIGKMCIAGTCLVLVLLFLEVALGGALMRFRSDPVTQPVQYMNDFNRGLNVFAILIWPAILFSFRHKFVYGLVMFLVAILLLSHFSTNAAFLATLAGAVVFVAVFAAPRITGIAVTLIVTAYFIAAPAINHFLPPPKELWQATDLPRSAYHRFLTWQFTTERIVERPFLGWGFNSSRSIPGAQEPLDVFEAALPLHPHSAPLQLWLELGVLGALIAGAAVSLVGERIRRRSSDKLSQAVASAAFVSATSVMCLSYGIWQSWWMSALFLAAGVTMVAAARPVGERES